MMIIL